MKITVHFEVPENTYVEGFLANSVVALAEKDILKVNDSVTVGHDLPYKFIVGKDCVVLEVNNIEIRSWDI